MRKKRYFFNKSHVGAFVLILLVVIITLCMCRESGNAFEPVLATDVSSQEKIAFSQNAPFAFDWNGNTLYVSCKKTVNFVTVDGNKKKRSGIILREFVFTHVSLPLKSQNVQEQNLFLGWLDTSLETKVFLYTKADNKKIDYSLYKLSSKAEKVVLQEGCFFAE